MTQNCKLDEGLNRGDLNRLVRDEVHIDEYTSKMADDRNVITTSFKVTDSMPANDLVSFIERGYDFVLDADISSGEMDDGDYLVFVEIERTELFPTQLDVLLYGVSQVCDVKQWSFIYKDTTVDGDKYPVSKRMITELVPLTPEAYDAANEPEADVEIDAEPEDILEPDDTIEENRMIEHMQTIAMIPRSKRTAASKPDLYELFKR